MKKYEALFDTVEAIIYSDDFTANPKQFEYTIECYKHDAKMMRNDEGDDYDNDFIKDWIDSILEYCNDSPFTDEDEEVKYWNLIESKAEPIRTTLLLEFEDD